MIDVDALRISEHALRRFCERSARLNGGTEPSNPGRSIRKMLRKAEPDDSMDEVQRVRRMLSRRHRAIGAKYLRRGEWRFVISDGVLLTVERTKHHQN